MRLDAGCREIGGLPVLVQSDRRFEVQENRNKSKSINADCIVERMAMRE